MNFRLLFTLLLLAAGTACFSQENAVTLFHAMEGSWLLDTATYEATYSPKLSLPPMRMSCEMTNRVNGLYCTFAVPGKEGNDTVVSGDYYVWDEDSGKVIMLSSENKTGKVTYAEIRKNVIAFSFEEKGNVVFEGELHVDAEQIELKSSLNEYQGMTGESSMTFFREN